ncbi:hypothetical protein FRC04_006170 [Tulasnella sp. 424]|nr:hypothetical protein FRC04_006170 [Tulasnella sp. 424]KAG8972987.1 hypothetical protein FRC05_009403 [Tulasnella sp. 425]
MDPHQKCKSPSPAYSLYQREIFLAGAKGINPSFSIEPEKLEISAKQKLTGAAFSYVAATAGSGWTERANREAFYHWRIIPRALEDTCCRDLTVCLFGHRIPAPVIFAPIGLNSFYDCCGGETIPAKIAGELGLPYCLSTAASCSIENVAAANDFGALVKNDSNSVWRGPSGTHGHPKAPRFFQLYMGHDDEVTLSLLNRAWTSGYDVLMFTVDAWQTGWASEAIDNASYPFYEGKGNDIGLSDAVFVKKHGDCKTDTTKWVDHHVYHGKAHIWEKVRWLVWQWRHITGGRPVVLKGILSAHDALKALEYGCDGIVVSNHGGRQIDGETASLDVLPEIVEAVKGRMTILFDSGIRTGSDIFKAVALGADAVLVGRPWVYGMAHGGERGVRHVMKSLLADLDITMTLAGYKSLKLDVNASALRWHPTGTSPSATVPCCKL